MLKGIPTTQEQGSLDGRADLWIDRLGGRLGIDGSPLHFAKRSRRPRWRRVTDRVAVPRDFLMLRGYPQRGGASISRYRHFPTKLRSLNIS
jgi:hypothetical protein